MSGVIAAALAALIGAASVLGSVDCSQIIQEAEYRKQQAQMQEQAGNYLIAIDAGHQGQGNFGQEPIGPGASETKNKVAAGTSGRTTGVPEYQLTLDISLQLRDALEEKGYQVLNRIEMLEQAENMPAKWQLLIYLGQQTIKNLQQSA